MTDSSMTQSMFDQRANLDSMRSALHRTDLALTDLALTDLAQIDLQNVAPTHSAPPAPVACRSHR